MKLSVKTIVYSALLIALSVLLRRVLTVPLPVGILNFGGFPVVFAGLLMGPASGALVGGVSDVISAFLFPKGPYVPFFTITSMLTGIIPPLTITLMKQKNEATFISILIAVTLAQSITKLLLIPQIMFWCFGITPAITLFKGAIMELFHIPLYAVLSRSLLLTQTYSYIRAKRRRLFDKKTA